MDLSSLLDGDGDGGGHGFQNAAYNIQSVTQSQVVLLLNIIGNLSQSLRLPSFSDDDHVGGPSCGGVKNSLEATIIKATDRIDEILDDHPRWNTKGTDSIQDMQRGLIEQQINTLKAQQKVFEADTRPALIFRPRIVFIDGRWWAIHGDTFENRVVGCGDTPVAAVRDFEKNYETATEPKATKQ